jgi:hypothetical protein
MCRQLDIVKRLMMKIDNPFTLYAPEMLVFVHTCIVTFGVTRTFHYESSADLTKCAQSSVYRIQRDARKCFFDLIMKLFGRWMVIGLKKLATNCYPLGGDFQTHGSAMFCKPVGFPVHLNTAYFGFYLSHSCYYI